VQDSDSEQQMKQHTSEDGEATILPDADFDSL
jgi:hypothetical protein